MLANSVAIVSRTRTKLSVTKILFIYVDSHGLVLPLRIIEMYSIPHHHPQAQWLMRVAFVAKNMQTSRNLIGSNALTI